MLDTKNKKGSLISLFTCGMGMDLGFEEAGFSTLYANDITNFACNTIRKNKPQIVCDEGDIANISSKEILKKIDCGKGEVDVVIGGPPCQSFSTAGMRKGLEDKRGLALLEYLRVIKDVQPKFFVFENVTGLKSIAKKHMSFYNRMSTKKEDISSDQQYGSLFADILEEFKKMKGYEIDWKILNSANYGVPQKRKRLILIGSRIISPEIIFEEIEKMSKYTDPKKVNVENKKPWNTLKHALNKINDDMEGTKFPTWGKYLKHVPAGGCWVDLPKKLQKEAMGKAANSDDPKRKGKQGGRTGFFRRLSWDNPAPTLVTSPTQKGTCICHPDETRPLTVREYARIQGFPDNWEFVGTTVQKYRMIGEAVPVGLAKVIGSVIKKFCVSNLDKVHEKELIELICLKVNKVGKTLASYVTENFDTLDEFLNADKNEFEKITDRKNRPKLKPNQITDILEQKKDIPKKLSVRETAFFVLAKSFLEGNVNNLQNLKLDHIDINPFLVKALGLKSSKEIISFNVYQAVTRSIVTSWGMMVENFLIYAGSEKNKEKFSTKEGSNLDLKKKTKNGTEYFQIKSGPNTMNVSMVNSLNDVFTVLKNKNLKSYLGMTYGKRESISPQIKSNLNDYDNATLIGKELWDYISEEENYHKKVIKAMTMATGGMLEKSFIMMIDDKINEIDTQWKEKFESKSLEEIFDCYL